MPYQRCTTASPKFQVRYSGYTVPGATFSRPSSFAHFGATHRQLRLPTLETPCHKNGDSDDFVCKVAAGAWHGMALTEDGEVYTWGHNASGQVTKRATTQRWRALFIGISVTQDPNTHIHDGTPFAN